MSTRPSIGEYLISSRSFAEYTAMFALDPGDLGGRVLDCPGGAASFTATACAQGIDAIAVDPVYATAGEELVERVHAEVQRGAAWARQRPEAYVWEQYGGPDAHTRVREESAATFAADLRAHPERYHPGSLPALPFATASADLVLSSHLLFTYADRLDRAFHLAALVEMARVARRQVRVYPLVDHTGAPLADLVAALVGDLAAGGVRARVQEVDYEFQRGARHVLVLDPARTAPIPAGPRTGDRAADAPGEA